MSLLEFLLALRLEEDHMFLLPPNSPGGWQKVIEFIHSTYAAGSEKGSGYDKLNPDPGVTRGLGGIWKPGVLNKLLLVWGWG